MRMFLPFVALAMLSLAGRASLASGIAGGYSASADAYTIGQASRAQTVRFGTVIAVRPVELAADAGIKAAGSGIGLLPEQSLGNGNCGG